jgi:hypothetical protein
MTAQRNLEAQDTLKATEDNYLYDYPRRDLHDIQVYLERILEIIDLESFDTGASRFCKNILVQRDLGKFESILSPAPLLLGYICTIGMLPLILLFALLYL